MMFPTRGDLIWLDFDPQLGREQAGRRPALVLSDAEFNRLTKFVWVCPITSQIKDYAFEIPLPNNVPVSGVTLTDQLKSLDTKVRNMKIIGHLSETSDTMQQVVNYSRLRFA